MEGLVNYDREVRPWGGFERFTLNEKSTVKILTLNPGEENSLQIHEHRAEFWKILKGSGIIRVGDDEVEVSEENYFFCPRNTLHRIGAGAEGLTFLEIAFGDFDEKDIKRLEDKYGRK